MITCAMCDDELPFAEQLRSFVMAYEKKSEWSCRLKHLHLRRNF